jgi:hypothetical protein
MGLVRSREGLFCRRDATLIIINLRLVLERNQTQSEPLQLTRLERIAIAHDAGAEAAFKPSHPLGGGAVRERIRHNLSLRLTLQCIVTDGGGGAERGIDVPAFEDAARFIGMERPDTGETVSLQFHADRECIGTGLGRATPGGIDLA